MYWGVILGTDYIGFGIGRKDGTLMTLLSCADLIILAQLSGD